MTWLVRSDVGLSRIGFMATSGAIPAAWAWAAWARPISWPAGVTAELSAMFWALNGATRTPRRASSRHSPVTTVLFPASLAVPQTMSPPCRPAARSRPPSRPGQGPPEPGQAGAVGDGDAHGAGQAEAGAVADADGPRRPAARADRARADQHPVGLRRAPAGSRRRRRTAIRSSRSLAIPAAQPGRSTGGEQFGQGGGGQAVDRPLRLALRPGRAARSGVGAST